MKITETETGTVVIEMTPLDLALLKSMLYAVTPPAIVANEVKDAFMSLKMAPK
jgi:hypothetical protein